MTFYYINPREEKKNVRIHREIWDILRVLLTYGTNEGGREVVLAESEENTRFAYTYNTGTKSEEKGLNWLMISVVFRSSRRHLPLSPIRRSLNR